MNREPDGPYVYQPFGALDPKRSATGRLYGVGGVSNVTRIEGLTRQEAEAIVAILRPIGDGWPTWERDPHDPDAEWRFDPKWGLERRDRFHPDGTSGNNSHPGTRERIALWARLAAVTPARSLPGEEENDG